MIRLLIISLLIFFSCKKNSSNNTDSSIDSIRDFKTSAQKKSTDNWNGKWIYVNKDKDSDIPNTQFTLTIIQEGNKIKAQYCAIADSGGKIDCESETIYNIEGIIYEKKIKGKFYSFFGSSNDKGEFELLMNDSNSLKWKIINPPNGVFYAPDECILEREINIDNKITNNNLKQQKIFPLNYENLDEKVKLETPKDNDIVNLFKQKYQLGIDAMAKLPSNENYDLYIVSNVSGDSELIYLITIKDSKLIDGLEIANSNLDNEKSTVFSINKNYDVFIYSEENNKKLLIETHIITDDGLFKLNK